MCECKTNFTQVWYVTSKYRERAIREQTDPMLSNGSRGILKSYADHSVLRRLKSQAPKVKANWESGVY